MDNRLEGHEDLGILLCMAYIAWADKSLSEAELKTIQAEASDQGLEDNEIEALVEVMLSRVKSPHELKRLLPDEVARRAAAYGGFVIALADHNLTVAELDAFDDLCAALQIPVSEAAEIRSRAERQVRAAKDGDWGQSLLLEQQL